MQPAAAPQPVLRPVPAAAPPRLRQPGPPPGAAARPAPAPGRPLAPFLDALLPSRFGRAEAASRASAEAVARAAVDPLDLRPWRPADLGWMLGWAVDRRLPAGLIGRCGSLSALPLGPDGAEERLYLSPAFVRYLGAAGLGRGLGPHLRDCGHPSTLYALLPRPQASRLAARLEGMEVRHG